MRQLEIHIPTLPPREASPNWNPQGQGIDYVRYKALKGWRELVYYSALSARNDWEKLHGNQYGYQPWEPLKAATISVTFQAPNKRYVQDDANALGGLKGAIDELTMPTSRGKRGAEILLDDSSDVLTWLKPCWEFGQAKATIIRVEEIE